MRLKIVFISLVGNYKLFCKVETCLRKNSRSYEDNLFKNLWMQFAQEKVFTNLFYYGKK